MIAGGDAVQPGRGNAFQQIGEPVARRFEMLLAQQQAYLQPVHAPVILTGRR